MCRVPYVVVVCVFCAALVLRLLSIYVNGGSCSVKYCTLRNRYVDVACGATLSSNCEGYYCCACSLVGCDSDVGHLCSGNISLNKEINC